MKRFLLGAAIAALLAPNAFGQVQADYNEETSRKTTCMGTDIPASEDCILFKHWPLLALSDEIVIVGSRVGYSDMNELTVPASVLSETEIAARGQQHISDLLRSLPGVAVNSSGPAGGLTQIRVRGSEANHVLVLIDGVEVANPSSGEFDFSGLRAEDVVRIETLRGEQSALYGSDAICLLYTSPSPRDRQKSRMPSSA